MSASQAVIAYQNLFEQAQTVTASSEITGFPARNAWDGVTTTCWQPFGTGDQVLTAVFASAVTADFLGVYAHNLASAGATIVLQYSTDNGGSWTNCFVPLAPADNACVLQRFAAVTASQWRVLAHNTVVPLYLGVLAFGVALVTYRGMPVGFIPPAEARVATIIPNTTEGGAVAGRSVIPLGADTPILINFVPMGWVRTVWRPFIKAAESKPFFFSWNHRDFPEECVFAMAKTPIPAPQMTEYKLYTLNLPIQCLLGAGV